MVHQANNLLLPEALWQEPPLHPSLHLFPTAQTIYFELMSDSSGNKEFMLIRDGRSISS